MATQTVLAAAQPAARWTVATTADVQATHSRVSRAGQIFNDEAIEVRPGIRLGSRQGWLQGSVDYSLGLEQHSSDVGRQVNHRLAANVLGTLVPNRLTVAVGGSYGRRNASAFDVQYAPDSVVAREQATEVGTATLAPTLRGPIADVANYEVGWRGSATNQRRSLIGDSFSETTTLNLRSVGTRAVAWAVSAERSASDFRTSGDTVTERATASLIVRPDIELELQLRAGTESQDGLNVGRDRRSTSGGEVQWRPGPRTRLVFGGDQRVFGRSSKASFEHRLSRSTFRLATVEDLLRDGNPSGLGSPQTLYDQLFTQLASQQPDPAIRDGLVRAQLQQLGLDPNTTVAGGFVAAGTSVQRRHDLSWSYGGVRTNLSLNAYAARTSRIDLQGGGQEPVKQAGYTATASHRLSPTMSMSIQGSRNRTKPQATQAGTDFKSLSVALSDRLGRHTTAQVSARYTVFNSVLNAYSEAAATATLSMRY